MNAIGKSFKNKLNLFNSQVFKVAKCNSADITAHVAACTPPQRIQKKPLSPSS